MRPSRATSLISRLSLAATVALLFLAGLTPLVSSTLRAQAIPSPEQLQQMLKANPGLLDQLRERVLASGMSLEQIRTRLRAAGYPDDLLDELMVEGAMGSGGGNTLEMLAAVRDLGLTDEADLRELQRLASQRGLDREGATRVDSLSLRDPSISAASAEIFGLSLFRGSTSLFMPNLDGPVDENYRLGPGDRLTLIITGDVERAHELDVSRQGTVLIPNVGLVRVANLTLGELEDVLYTRLGRVYSSIRRGAGATAHFTVNVTELRSNQVFVTGDVQRPGSYRVTSAGTVLTALYAAGGPTERGSLRRIEVRRAGELVSTLDLYDYLLRGDASRDVRLRQGDVVFVPVHGPRVRLDGEVMRPATYESKLGESLADIVAAAGGLKATAGARRLVVERILPVADRTAGRVRTVMDVPLGDDGAVPAIAAADGDLVRVPGIADRVRDRVVVKGHVWTPGPQGFTAGLTLEEALRRAGGLQPDAYLGTVHVSRLRPDSTRVQLRAMLADTTGATLQPLTLEPDDEITVYSRTAFRPPRHVVIGGEVRDGGRFQWREGMTLRDLVLMAGGLTDAAYLVEAEVARIPADRDTRVTATTMRVPLDSSYRFEAGTALSAASTDIALQPYDNVLIMRDPTWRAPRSVWLTGEIARPGRYTLAQRAERLSDLIERAGGLTPEADPRAAYFTRVTDSTTFQRLAASRARRRVGDSIPVTADTAPTVNLDSIRATLQGRRSGDSTVHRMRVGVDLQQALRGRTDDLILRDGDSLHVPGRSQIVEVRGGVNHPTALAYAGGAGLGFYVNAAGGTTELARTREMYVIQPNGKVETRRHFLWLMPMDPKPLPGAVVIVPERSPNVAPPNTLGNVSLVAQVLATLATIIYLTR